MLLRHSVNLTRQALMASPPVHMRRGYMSYLVGRNTVNACNEMLTRHEEALYVLSHPQENETPEHQLDRIHEILIREIEERKDV